MTRWNRHCGDCASSVSNCSSCTASTPETSLADQLGALRHLQAEGKIGRIGLSEVTVDELRQAGEIVDLASVQNRYNLLDREHEPVLAACEEAGSRSCRGVLSPGESGTRAGVAAVAAEFEATPTQVALAWLLDHSPVILPTPGPLGSITWRRTSPRNDSS